MSLTIRSRLLLVVMLLVTATAVLVWLITGCVGTSPGSWASAGAHSRDCLDTLPQAVRPALIGALVLLALGLGGALWLAWRIELQLAHALERVRQAEQLALQDQRAHVLGRLTGRVAHDVNNLLGVVSNNMHLIRHHPAAAELQVPLAGMQRAVESGSQHMQLLLRFARRQPMRPQLLALDQHLLDVQELMHGLLGRRIEVSVQVDAATEPVQVDAAELELALITLALDASDAKPGSVELHLSARNARTEETDGLAGHPGRAYVVVDVGYGASPVSGPGLSQAHDVCTRAGGTLRIGSTDGVTTVSLLLPAWRGGNEATGRSGNHR